MEWSEVTQLHLIEAYRSQTILWDPKHRDHYKKHLKEDAWRIISEELKIPAEFCKKKMICLLASNRREKSKTKSSRGTGKGSDEIYVSRWFAFEAFKFLEDRDLPRVRLNTETEQIVENEEEQTTPRPKKRKNDESPMMSSAFQILKNAARKMDREPDEMDAFFDFVKTKTKKYSPTTQNTLQHAIFELLMKADRGFFETEGEIIRQEVDISFLPNCNNYSTDTSSEQNFDDFV